MCQIKKSDQDRLKELLADYQELPEYFEVPLTGVNVRSLFGDYPIYVAITRRNLEDVIFLRRMGAELDVVGDEGYTPLHQAVESGDLEIVRYILSEGGGVDKRNNFDLTPLELAEALGLGEIVIFLQNT